MTKLHAHVFKGALLSVTLKKRLDAVAKPPRRPAAPPTSTSTATPTTAAPLVASVAGRPAGPAPSRASRLIVRNLPFDVTEQDLRAVFLPYGPIYAVHIPTTLVIAPAAADSDSDAAKAPNADADGDVKMEEGEEQEKGATEKARTRGKGFAFVWMWSKKEAEKAMEGCNGTKVRAGFAQVAAWYAKKRDEGPFIMGVEVSWADFVVGAHLVWLNKAWGEDDPKWKAIMQWDDGTWKTLFDALKEYGASD